MRLPSDKERESYPIDQWFDRSSVRCGHLITPGSRPSKIGPLQISSFAEPDELGKPGAHDSVIENAAAKSPIRRILIPIDATQVKSSDLKPVLKVAQRFDAEVTLLHCYEIPLSFHYAVGRSALKDVVLHSDLVRTQLLQLCAEVRKFFASCRSEFTFGSLPVEILRASQRLQSDLIVVPLALDFGSYSWTTKKIMDELVRKANCPVVGIRFQSEEPVVSIRYPEDSI
jgi:nucleotide-binding universal stress UspA family protein